VSFLVDALCILRLDARNAVRGVSDILGERSAALL